MELHIAIKNILKYQGDAFLHDPKIINALSDFNGFDAHPCVKNIFRILLADGIIDKFIEKDNLDSNCVREKLYSQISTNYGWPKGLVQFIVESVLYGAGKLDSMSNWTFDSHFPNVIAAALGSCEVPPKPVKWKELDKTGRIEYLESIIAIDDTSFEAIGLRMTSVSVSDVRRTKNKLSFCLTTEIRTINGDDEITGQLNFDYILYDTSNKIRGTYCIYYLAGVNRYLIDNTWLKFDVDDSVEFSKLLIRISEP